MAFFIVIIRLRRIVHNDSLAAAGNLLQIREVGVEVVIRDNLFDIVDVDREYLETFSLFLVEKDLATSRRILDFSGEIVKRRSEI